MTARTKDGRWIQFANWAPHLFWTWLGALGLRTKGERDDRVLIVIDHTEDVVWKSFRNLGNRVKLGLPRELNTYDVLVSDWLVFSRDSLDLAIAHFGERADEQVDQPSERDEEQS